MARERFVERKFSEGSLFLIRRANTIVQELAAEGYSLSLRQLFYQFVGRDWLPNTQKNYKRLGAVLNDARLAGLLDWNSMEDRTRTVRCRPTWTSASEIVAGVGYQYTRDRWRDQPIHVEVWPEKDAMTDIVSQVCGEFQVSFFACRGYNSQSAQHAAGKRFARVAASGKRILVLHLGDHDPSGVDMSRDNMERLRMFSGLDPSRFEFRRILLNQDQIVRYRLPPQPSKETDSRIRGYEDLHGEGSWELDALRPSVIAGLIRDNIRSAIDWPAWEAHAATEARERKVLLRLVARWPSIELLLTAEETDPPGSGGGAPPSPAPEDEPDDPPDDPPDEGGEGADADLDTPDGELDDQGPPDDEPEEPEEFSTDEDFD
jgi:hypothetical protein